MLTPANKKLCLIFNIASHYRESIFKQIERTFDCDWYFGRNETNIKSLDTSIFKRVKLLENRSVISPSITYRKGLSSLISKKDYSTFLITGETHNLSVWSLLIKSKLLYRKKKIYLWTHGWYGKETYKEKILKKLFFRCADGIFLYGNYAKGLMMKEGINENKLFVLHNSLQYEKHLELRNEIRPMPIFRNHFGNDNLNIVFIGRLTKVKKLDLLLKAISILKSKGFNYNLTFIGDGDIKEGLIEYANKENISDNVWFYGACYDEAVNAALIYNADLCVSPGNVGLTALHCMTFGTPVITHNNFAYQMPEFETIQENVTGDFFEQDNVDSLVSTILKWFENHKDREIVRKDCYKEIDNSWTPEYQINVLKNNLKFD